jgi:type I restriction enzyme, S subunit
MLRYLEYVVNSDRAQEQVRQKSSGALLSHFNAVDAGDLIIPYRELSQQERIVAELDWACSKIDRTIGLIQAQIMLLQEHRQALIAAAVTGEMDVPGCRHESR